MPTGLHWESLATIYRLLLLLLSRFSLSESVRSHIWQPTRLLCPWDSPGKNNGVGCHLFSNAWKWKVKVKSLSRAWLFATPWTAAYKAPPSMRFSRQEYWSGLPLPSPIYNNNKHPLPTIQEKSLYMDITR